VTQTGTDVGAIDPVSGLVLFELSHVFGHYAPVQPGMGDIEIRRVATHAMHGVLTSHLKTTMHHGTHLNAPLYLAQGGLTVGQLPLDRTFGNGVVLPVEKGEWEYVEPADLEQAAPAIEPGDIVVIVTGWHHRFGETMEYFGHGPGLSEQAAGWLVARGVKLVAVDTPSVDHPLATSIAQQHRFIGPHVVELPRRYRQRTGREVTEDFPAWQPAHKVLAKAGIPTIENVGADVDALLGKRATFHAVPWKWVDGEACIIRFVAMLDGSDGNYRIEKGA
jgi:kynurenine formamidase